MTMLNRAKPEASPEMALTPTEIYLLDQLVSDKPDVTPTSNTLSLYLTKLATRRLPRSRQRSTSRQYSHVERTESSHRQPARFHPWHSTCG
jgi:hypothetical protein